MILSATGHRPNRLGGYGQDVLQKLIDVAKKAMVELEPDTVISGMALGWDTAVAIAAVELNIPFIAYVPFLGQESRWPEPSQAMHRELLAHACDVIYVSPPGYSPHKMMLRNNAMNDASDVVLAMYDGSGHGGTAQCVRDALRASKTVKNAWGIFSGESETLTTIETNDGR